MTHKAFWDDPYQTVLDARVETVEGPDITLDRTILYAFHGGQERDDGAIGGHPMRDARWGADGTLTYRLDPGHGLAPGDTVTLTLDWERRYRLMRLHFAAELVLETTGRRFPGISKIGAHIAADKARLDFRLDESLAPHLPAIGAAVADLIIGDHAIVSAFRDRAREERTWSIAGFAEVPCGGTHLRRTSEIGELSLRRRNVGKSKERIEITLLDLA